MKTGRGALQPEGPENREDGNYALFKTVSRDLTLTERARRQLESLILDRALRAGDRLPSQDELARLLGVSRTVVREAVQLLTATGLLEPRKGSGIYVRALGSDLVKEPVNLLIRSRLINRENIMEARHFLEPKIAELAAERAQPDDIEFLQESVHKMAGRKLSPSRFASTDLAFHNRLATASGNPLLLAMATSINDVMINVHHLATNLYGTAWICEQASYHHSRILDGVKARNAEEARRAMEEHMKFARKVLEEIEAGVSRQPLEALQGAPAAGSRSS